MIIMDLRLATHDDLDSLMDVVRRCVADLDARGIHQWDEIYPSLNDFLGDVSEGGLYVIFDNGRLRGCVCLNELEHPGYERAAWQGTEFLVVHKLLVDPLRQGRGLGRFAMNRMEVIARSNRKDSIRLDCFDKNESANRFYQGLGYVFRGEAPFRKGTFNLYEKTL